jgi:hypothetical protein
MGEIIADPLNKTVKIRGIHFPIDCILAAMYETGGQVVNDQYMNFELDAALMNHRGVTGKEPERVIIEALPGYYFIPKQIKLHHMLEMPEGKDTGIYLYFAVPKRF